MREWQQVTLGSLGADRKAAFATGPFGSAVSSKNFVESGVPMIRGNNLSADVGRRLDDDDLVFVPESIAEKFSRSLVEHGDLVFTCWGTIGQIGLLDGRTMFEQYLVSNKQMKMSPDRSRVDPSFLYYYLSQPRMLGLVRGQTIGSSVPGFNLGQLKSLPIDLPEVTEQQAIAEVLGALDDKIAANDHTAHSLADMASARFDQMRASANRQMPMSELVTTQYGVTTSATTGDGPRLLRVTDINKRPWIEWNSAPACDLDDAQWDKYRVRGGDILVARMADPGKVAFIDSGDPDAVFASYLVRILPHDPALALYIYYFMRSREYQNYARSSSSGSVQRNMNARVIVGTSVALPNDEHVRRFNTIVKPIRESLRAVRTESTMLAATRDELLPLLMSGKVRVKDAERRVEGEV